MRTQGCYEAGAGYRERAERPIGVQSALRRSTPERLGALGMLSFSGPLPLALALEFGSVPDIFFLDFFPLCFNQLFFFFSSKRRIRTRKDFPTRNE